MEKSKLFGQMLILQVVFGVLLGGFQVFELSLNSSWWMTTTQAMALAGAGVLIGGTVGLALSVVCLPLMKWARMGLAIQLWTLAAVIHLGLLFGPFIWKLLQQGQETLSGMIGFVWLLFSFLIWSNTRYWFRKLEAGMLSLRKITFVMVGTALLASGIALSNFRSQSLGTEKSIVSDPDVIVVTIDGLGANAVSSLSKNSLASTPNIDALGSQCIQYNDAISVASSVLPSQTAMLSGHYPGQLGVLNNDGLVRFTVETIAEPFSREGYATAIFADNLALTLETGFAQGFQLVDVNTGASIGGYEIKGVSSFQVIRLLETWIQSRTPMQALHHTRKFLSDYHRLPVFVWTQLEIPSGLEQSAYREVVEDIDQELGDFVRMLRNREVDRERLLIVTGGFGTHFDFGNGSHLGVSDAVLKVPMIICPLRGAGTQGGQEVDTQVRTIDLPNTIYAQVGFSHNKKIQSIDISDLSKEPNVYQTLLMGEDPTDEGGYELGYRFQASNSDKMYKYRWKTHRKLHAVYNLSADPEERQNIVEQAGSMTQELSMALTQATRSIPELDLSENLLMVDAFQPIP